MGSVPGAKRGPFKFEWLEGFLPSGPGPSTFWPAAVAHQRPQSRCRQHVQTLGAVGGDTAIRNAGMHAGLRIAKPLLHVAARATTPTRWSDNNTVVWQHVIGTTEIHVAGGQAAAD